MQETAQAHSQKKSTPTDLESFYTEVRKHTEKLCEPLETEDYIPQPIVDVSPPRWHIAHTTWFFEEMILKKFHGSSYEEFDPNFGFLFNSYYDTVGDRTKRHKRGDLSRPTVKKVYEYRRCVDEKMHGFLKTNLSGEVKELVVLGLHHEQQHQELFLTDFKYTISCNPLYPVYKKDFALCEIGEIERNGNDEFITMEGGIYEIGFAGGEGFHFDNELGRHKVYLQDFAIQKDLITNGEWLEFIEDGGYENHSLWHSEGWDWVNKNRINSPLYWIKKDHDDDGIWHQFTLGGLRKLNSNNPVAHISLYEASAFAEWKGLRLPTELEWEAASDMFDWGLRWEWTNSAYLPYPNFRKAAGAVGEYNGKFMINQMVLRGASVATSPKHSRKTYRNFFHPHLRWQFTGLRLAKYSKK